MMFCILPLLLMFGCAGTTTFTAYPTKINPYIASIQTRTPIDFTQCLISECESKDLILYNMERGRIAQLTGDLDNSQKDFRASIEQIKLNDEKAHITASGIGSNFAAAAVNDNAIPYVGSGYERVMLHHYQAMNYIKKQDLDGAGVEVRVANAEQEAALKQFEGDLEKAQKDAEEKNVNSDSNSKISSQYAQMDEVAGKVKNSFQNAYTFYLSGFIYELNKQYNDAYIDYKKALEIYPENTYLQKDVLRLADTLDMREDISALSERFNISPIKISSGSGELLVIYEDGFAPQKQEVKIPIPVPRVGLLAIAFPIYKESWTRQVPLNVSDNTTQIGITEPICDFRALAVKALKEQIPVIAVRQVVRAAAKGAASLGAKKVADQLGVGFLGTLTASIYNYASENADLRSWLTLPSNAQILRTQLQPGMHKIALTSPVSAGPFYVDVEISAGGKTILHVVRAGSQFYMSSTPFKLQALSAQL
ncbi:MAG: hypothetical protein JJE30_17605 [Desulfuromonadales bacterium]|nr:hypothetical protein [Desulfuromonadales bacterium]